MIPGDQPEEGMDMAIDKKTSRKGKFKAYRERRNKGFKVGRFGSMV